MRLSVYGTTKSAKIPPMKLVELSKSISNANSLSEHPSLSIVSVLWPLLGSEERVLTILERGPLSFIHANPPRSGKFKMRTHLVVIGLT
jgi:hypothetical protein